MRPDTPEAEEHFDGRERSQGGRRFRVAGPTPVAQRHRVGRAMKSRLLFLMLQTAVVVSACATSESGEAPGPVLSGPGSTSAAGLAALSVEPLDSATCQGVLASPPSSHTLELQSLTDSGQAGNQEIDAMCAAVYETATPGDPFLTVALIQFDSDGPAITHYDLLRGAFVAQGIAISELNSADENLLDSVSGLIDRDGIGRTTVMRQNDWLLTVSVGPTTNDSLWTAGDIQMIGESILSRARTED